jgi:hypothetical protein
MKALRVLAALTCPLAILMSSLSPSPLVKWLMVPSAVGGIAAVVVSLRDKQEQSVNDRAALSLRS